MNKRRLKKALRKASYEVGPTGCGVAALSAPRPHGKMTWRERLLLTPVMEAEAKRRQGAFRTACMEVLGEDPEDWGLSPEEIDAKYKETF